LASGKIIIAIEQGSAARGLGFLVELHITHSSDINCCARMSKT
jgi:hypothetical protein